MSEKRVLAPKNKRLQAYFRANNLLPEIEHSETSQSQNNNIIVHNQNMNNNNSNNINRIGNSNQDANHNSNNNDNNEPRQSLRVSTNPFAIPRSMMSSENKDNLFNVVNDDEIEEEALDSLNDSRLSSLSTRPSSNTSTSRSKSVPPKSNRHDRSNNQSRTNNNFPRIQSIYTGRIIPVDGSPVIGAKTTRTPSGQLLIAPLFRTHNPIVRSQVRAEEKRRRQNEEDKKETLRDLEGLEEFNNREAEEESKVTLSQLQKSGRNPYVGRLHQTLLAHQPPVTPKKKPNKTTSSTSSSNNDSNNSFKVPASKTPTHMRSLQSTSGNTSKTIANVNRQKPSNTYSSRSSNLLTSSHARIGSNVTHSFALDPVSHNDVENANEIKSNSESQLVSDSKTSNHDSADEKKNQVSNNIDDVNVSVEVEDNDQVVEIKVKETPYYCRLSEDIIKDRIVSSTISHSFTLPMNNEINESFVYKTLLDIGTLHKANQILKKVSDARNNNSNSTAIVKDWNKMPSIVFREFSKQRIQIQYDGNLQTKSFTFRFILS
jgi:hypothetical protein